MNRKALNLSFFACYLLSNKQGGDRHLLVIAVTQAGTKSPFALLPSLGAAVSKIGSTSSAVCHSGSSSMDPEARKHGRPIAQETS